MRNKLLALAALETYAAAFPPVGINRDSATLYPVTIRPNVSVKHERRPLTDFDLSRIYAARHKRVRKNEKRLSEAGCCCENGMRRGQRVCFDCKHDGIPY